MMNQLIERFPAQLAEALDIGRAAEINAHEVEINKAYVAGLGGSGIGGNFVAELIRDEASIPYNVGKGYGIPAYIDRHTLCIISSYSGNTEETLSAFEQILTRGAKIVCISSGGKIIEKAQELGLDYIKVPDNWPSPRACLGYSLVQQLFVLYKLGFIKEDILNGMKSSIDLLKYDQDDIQATAKRVAELMQDKTPVIYTTDRMESVAIRLRQQINENAKLLCWHHVVPEMNHNELVGWKDRREDIAVLYLRNKDDYDRNAIRIDINKGIINKYTDHIIEVYSKGQTLAEKMMYFVHLGDWVSWYLAEQRGEDSIEVKVIDYLKSELGKV